MFLKYICYMVKESDSPRLDEQTPPIPQIQCYDSCYNYNNKNKCLLKKLLPEGHCCDAPESVAIATLSDDLFELVAKTMTWMRDWERERGGIDLGLVLVMINQCISTWHWLGHCLESRMIEHMEQKIESAKKCLKLINTCGQVQQSYCLKAVSTHFCTQSFLITWAHSTEAVILFFFKPFFACKSCYLTRGYHNS